MSSGCILMWPRVSGSVQSTQIANHHGMHTASITAKARARHSIAAGLKKVSRVPGAPSTLDNPKKPGETGHRSPIINPQEKKKRTSARSPAASQNAISEKKENECNDE